jgi:large subunit ribosomal protein L21
LEDGGATLMYAVIETGGKQYKVAEGDVIFVEKLGAAEGETVSFDVVAVLDGQNTKIGTPIVAGATVTAEILANTKGKKVRVFKYKPKKGYHKRHGHRQPLDKITIKEIKA